VKKINHSYLVQQCHNSIWQTIEQYKSPADARNRVSELRAETQDNGGNAWTIRMKVAA
jgi:hypothetical protein